MGYEPEKAYEVLTGGLKKQYIEFCDASLGDPYTLSLLNCLKAVKKAFTYGFFDFNNFDYFEYEHYEVSFLTATFIYYDCQFDSLKKFGIEKQKCNFYLIYFNPIHFSVCQFIL